MAEYKKPLPAISPVSRRFWEGCKQHRLLIQRCHDCGAYRHYPRPMCPQCNSMNTDWVEVSGKGKVFTWTTVHHPAHPAFMDLPYAVVVVELEEGARLVTNVVDCKPEELYIGMPVKVVFEDVTNEITLPKFRPISSPR